jgi:hypothetical protein
MMNWISNVSALSEHPAHEPLSFLTQLVLYRGKKWLKQWFDDKRCGRRPALKLPFAAHKAADQKGRTDAIANKDSSTMLVRQNTTMVDIGEQKIVKVRRS